jgi:S1-C subfamily serine protease
LINEVLARLAIGSLLGIFLAASAPASEIDLTKIVGVVAGETWPEGKIPAGTGFFVGSGGQILTAAHVVAGCHSIKIAALHNGSIDYVNAVIVGVDGRIDAALLIASSVHSNTYIRFTDDLPDVGDQLVIPTRSATDDTFHAIDGRALGVMRVAGEGNLLHVEGKLVPGSSGAPVIDTYGNAVGYVIGRMRDRPEVGLAVPATSITTFIRYFDIPTSLKSEHGITGIIGAFVGDKSGSGFDDGRIDKLTVSVECH